MEKLLEPLCRDDDEEVQKTVYKVYGYIYQWTGIYPVMITRNQKIFAAFSFAIYILVNLYHLILLALTIYYASDEILIRLGSISYLMEGYELFYISLIAFFYRRRMARALKAVCNGLITYEGMPENSIKAKIEAKRKFLVKFTSRTLLACGFLIEIVPLHKLFWKKDTEIYTTGGVSLNLARPLWVPYGTETNFTLAITIILKVIYEIFLVSTGAGVMVLCIDLTRTTVSEIQNLIKSLEALPQRTEFLYRKIYKRSVDLSRLKEDKQLEACLKMCLKENAIHYERIISLFNDFNDTMSYPLLVTFVNAAVFIAVCGSLLFKLTQPHTVITIALIALMDIICMFGLCLCGEKISLASDELRKALYATDWMCMTKSAAMYIQIMSSRAERPLVLYCGGLYKINFETYSEVINSSYSLFNVFYAANSD